MAGDSGFPRYRAFRHTLGKRNADFDKALNSAAMLFVAGADHRDQLSFNVELGDGINVAVTMERR
ncbi:MAG TPA: hypothetical protein VGF92_01530 [Stellaceae bacterium]|jgi:hypothetical protein